MANFMKVIITILVLKVVTNCYYTLLAIYYKSQYEKYIKSGEGWGIRERKQDIEKLFKKAGVEDARVSMVEPAGYGMIQTGHVSVFENIHIRREDVAQIIYGKFKETIHIYKQRIFETINPFYWIEVIIYLPKVVLTYLNVNGESIVVKILQIVWWIFVTVLSIFSNDLRTYIVDKFI